MSDLKRELRTTKDKVESILENHPSTRDNDKFLWLAYMNKHHDLRKTLGVDSYDKLKKILLEKEVPLFESVRRVRQKLQQEGKYHGKKRKNRMHLEKEVRNWTRE